MSSPTDRLSAALDGRYRIERHLGQGGMATVYLAEDLKHDRKVAVKVLKPELAAVLGAERFVQEIKTTASLSHPHILPLFDSGTADGFLFYVMPFIEGETIRDKLNRETQFGVDEAVRMTREVADALDYAHRRGIIHRDIKPENVLLHDGRAIVMDFGIALAVSAAAGGRMTETGLSLGTPHYMSPEQATAEKELTPRSDIYSLASVLYEMLSGQPPHLGGSAQQIIMRIIADTPRPVTDLRRSVPLNVASAVSKALEKLPADRFDTAKAFAEALGTPGFSYATVAGHAGTAHRVAGSGTSRRALLAVTVLTSLVIGAAGWATLRPAPAAAVMRYDLTLGDAPLNTNDVVISPNGKMLAYIGTVGTTTAIFVRRLDGDADFRMLAGTESATNPAFSPDNQWIVFHRDRDGAIAKISIASGAQTTLVPDANGYNPHWGTPDLIVFNGPQGAYVVSAVGGKPPRKLKNVVSLSRRTFLLPDGSAVLGANSDGIVCYDLKTDSMTVIMPNGRHPVYSSSGHLLFVDDQNGLSAVAFDLKRHRVIGTAVRVLERVASNVNRRGFSISENGTLVQFEGAGSSALANTRLVIHAIDGKSADTLPLPSARRTDVRFSPDGNLVAYVMPSQRGPSQNDIYTFDLRTGTNTQVTFDGSNLVPVWSPDGKQLLYGKDSAGRALHIKSADNSGNDRTLPRASDEDAIPSAWPSDSLIVYNSRIYGGGLNVDLVTMSIGANEKRVPYLSAPWSEAEAAISPDGRLAAFTAREGAVDEVWLRDFPTPAGKWKISGNASTPRWSRDGRYIYFLKLGYLANLTMDSLFRAEITRTPSMVVHTPVPIALVSRGVGRFTFDLHPDGKRYIVPEVEESAAAARVPSAQPATRFVVITNWFTEMTAAVKKANP